VTLNFTFDYNAESYCDAMGDLMFYYLTYGHDDLWKLGSFEFIHQLDEILSILLDGLEPSETKYLTKYNWRLREENSALPKLMLYLSHAEN
jgi:hypothetical protein